MTFVLLIGRALDRQLVLHLFVVGLKSDKYEERSLLETKQKLYLPLKFHEQERERERERDIFKTSNDYVHCDQSKQTTVSHTTLRYFSRLEGN